MRYRISWKDGRPFLFCPPGVSSTDAAKRANTASDVKGPADVRDAQTALDRIGFIEFVGEALGKILMIAIDQIVHVCFLVPIVWMTPP